MFICVCVCGCIARCQQAPQACTVYPFQNPSNAAIPFKAVSGVAELLLEVKLLLVLEKKKHTVLTSGNYFDVMTSLRTSEFKKKNENEESRSGQLEKTATTQGEPLKLCLSFVTFDLPSCLIVIIFIITSSTLSFRP